MHHASEEMSGQGEKWSPGKGPSLTWVHAGPSGDPETTTMLSEVESLPYTQASKSSDLSGSRGEFSSLQGLSMAQTLLKYCDMRVSRFTLIC